MKSFITKKYYPQQKQHSKAKLWQPWNNGRWVADVISDQGRWGKVGVPRESQEAEPKAGIWDDINEDHLGRQ